MVQCLEAAANVLELYLIVTSEMCSFCEYQKLGLYLGVLFL